MDDKIRVKIEELLLETLKDNTQLETATALMRLLEKIAYIHSLK